MQTKAGRPEPRGEYAATMFQRLFRRSDRDATEPLYLAIVAQARQPVFYEELRAPDTPEGRFDMIVLHMILVIRRIRREGEGGRHFAQRLFDTLFRDMDRSLREMGVGDLVVPKRIRAMGEAFYGRARRYDPALDAADEAELAAGLAANLFVREPDEEARRLARYALAAERSLAEATVDDIRRGVLAWPSV